MARRKTYRRKSSLTRRRRNRKSRLISPPVSFRWSNTAPIESILGSDGQIWDRFSPGGAMFGR